MPKNNIKIKKVWLTFQLIIAAGLLEREGVI